MDIGINLSINGSNVIGSTGLTPPLDLVTGAQTAYSIARKLRTTYSGSAIRVRESSGDTEADIGFDADGNLDETALLAHCGSNSGYITTAYDQSGNSNDWTQSTANLQSRIVNAGTVDKVNGKPAILSDATASSQDRLTATLTGSATTTAFHVIKSTRARGYICEGDSGTEFYGYFRNTTGNSYQTAGTPTNYVNGSAIGGLRSDLYTAIINIQCNLSLINLDLSTWSELNTNGVSDSFQPPDYIQETIIYDSDKSSDRAAIEANINEYYSIY